MSSVYFDWKTGEYRQDRKRLYTRGGGSRGSNNPPLPPSTPSANVDPNKPFPQVLIDGAVYRNQSLVDTAATTGKPINQGGINMVLAHQAPNADPTYFEVQQNEAFNPFTYQYEFKVVSTDLSNVAFAPTAENDPNRPTGGDLQLLSYNMRPINPNAVAQGTVIVEYFIVQDEPPEGEQPWGQKATVEFFYQYLGPPELDGAPNPTVPPLNPAPSDYQDLIDALNDQLTEGDPPPVCLEAGLPTNDVTISVGLTDTQIIPGATITTFEVCGTPEPAGFLRNLENGYTADEEFEVEVTGTVSPPQPLNVTYTPIVSQNPQDPACVEVKITHLGNDTPIYDIVFTGTVKNPYQNTSATVQDTLAFDANGPPPPGQTYQLKALGLDDTIEAVPSITLLDSPAGEPPYPTPTFTYPFNMVQGAQPSLWANRKTFEFLATPTIPLLNQSPYTTKITLGYSSTPDGVSILLKPHPTLENRVLVTVSYDGDIVNTTFVAETNFTTKATYFENDVEVDAIDMPWKITWNNPAFNVNIKVGTTDPKITDNTVPTAPQDLPAPSQVTRVLANKFTRGTVAGSSNNTSGNTIGVGFLEYVLKRSTDGAYDTKPILIQPYWNSTTTNVGIALGTDQDLTTPAGITVRSKAVRLIGPNGNINVPWQDNPNWPTDNSYRHQVFAQNAAAVKAICSPGLNFLEWEFDIPKRDVLPGGLKINKTYTSQPIAQKVKKVFFSASKCFWKNEEGSPFDNNNSAWIDGEGYTQQRGSNTEVWYWRIPLSGLVSGRYYIFYSGGVVIGPPGGPWVGQPSQEGFSGEPAGEFQLEPQMYVEDDKYATFTTKRPPGGSTSIEGFGAWQYLKP